MEPLTVREITDAVQGKLLCGDPDTVITYVSIDSRDIRENTIFAPIIGARVDAHTFIGQVFADGAKAAFTSRGEIVDETKPHILVENTQTALIELAVYYRGRFQIPVIGVTGSVGKTSTKEMIAAALQTQYTVLKTAGNYNSTIGLPLMIFRMEAETQIAVLEMGISHFGEMDALVRMARPRTAVVTNIGVAHIGNLGSQENILREKLKIADSCTQEGQLLLNGNDPLLIQEAVRRADSACLFGCEAAADTQVHNQADQSAREMAAAAVQEPAVIPLLPLRYYAKDIHIRDGRQVFTFVWPQGETQVTIQQIGRHNVTNAVAALAVALQYGIDPDTAKEGLAACEGLPMRQQILHLADGIKVIDDTYNASPDSIRGGIGVLKLLDNPGRRLAVLGDVLELGEMSGQCHYELGEFVAASGIDAVIAVGTQMRVLASAVQEHAPWMSVHTFDSNTEAAAYLTATVAPGDALLVKGSRGMHLEEVVQALVKFLSGDTA